jgi:hypothetical protein
MKKIIFISAICLMALISFRAKAQNPETTMKPMLEDAMVYCDTIEKYGNEIVRMEFDLVTSSKSKTTYRELYTGWEYTIWVFGDYRISDIDITVYKDVNGKWVQVQKDNSSESSAFVKIEPSSTGQYRIDVIAYKFKEGYQAGHYGLLVFHK